MKGQMKMNDVFFWMFHITFWLFMAIGNSFKNQKVRVVCDYAQTLCLGAMFMFVLQCFFVKGA